MQNKRSDKKKEKQKQKKPQKLKARLARGPLNAAEITQVVDAVGSALAYAHKQGILHRDVKPSNVLIDDSGNCLLSDFGLARMVDFATGLFPQYRETLRYRTEGGLLRNQLSKRVPVIDRHLCQQAFGQNRRRRHLDESVRVQDLRQSTFQAAQPGAAMAAAKRSQLLTP